MRSRDGFWLSLAVVVACAVPGHAEVRGDRIADQLRALGFSEVEVSRTLLGRTRIVADGRPGHREIVLDPRTGEILRDLFLKSREDAAHSEESGRGSGSGSSGSGGSGSSGSGSGRDDSDSDDSDSDDSGDDGGSDDGGGDDGGGRDGGGDDGSDKD